MKKMIFVFSIMTTGTVFGQVAEMAIENLSVTKAINLYVANFKSDPMTPRRILRGLQLSQAIEGLQIIAKECADIERPLSVSDNGVLFHDQNNISMSATIERYGDGFGRMGLNYLGNRIPVLVFGMGLKSVKGEAGQISAYFNPKNGKFVGAEVWIYQPTAEDLRARAEWSCGISPLRPGQIQQYIDAIKLNEIDS